MKHFLSTQCVAHMDKRNWPSRLLIPEPCMERSKRREPKRHTSPSTYVVRHMITKNDLKSFIRGTLRNKYRTLEPLRCKRTHERQWNQCKFQNHLFKIIDSIHYSTFLYRSCLEVKCETYRKFPFL